MALKKEEIEKARDALKFSKRPLLFFHDDPDGLCSFLQFYRHCGSGKGVIVKTHPNIDHKFLKAVSEYEPDRIFILDIALVEQEFIDSVKKHIVWIDHHGVQQRNGVLYINPRKENSKNNVPASCLCYEITGNRKDIWIATVGAIGDWCIPYFIAEFRADFPDLIPPGLERPQDILFSSRLGKLAKIFSFVLKGTTQEAMKYVKILTRIESPYEVLEQASSRGKYVYKRYSAINREYEELLKEIAGSYSKDDRMLVHIYSERKMSFTGDITNELLFMFPDKVILVGREKNGEVKCSLRSPQGITVADKLERALEGVNGYGGGHEYACGAVVRKEDFRRFVRNLRRELFSSSYDIFSIN